MAESTPADSALKAALSTARRNATDKGRPFSLTLDDLREIWRNQDGRCLLSGIEFHEERFPEAFVKRPFAPSLDRSDSAAGYVPDNVRLVCAAVNFARGQWGDDVLREIAHGIVETEARDNRAWYARYRAKLNKAKSELNELSGEERRKQKRVIAGLKATMSKGPSRLRSAGRRAQKTREKP